MPRNTTGPSGTAATPRRGAGRRPTLQLLVDDGPVQLVKADGRVLLRQGDVAIDVTAVFVQENYAMGRISLALRREQDAQVTVVANDAPPADQPEPEPELAEAAGGAG